MHIFAEILEKLVKSRKKLSKTSASCMIIIGLETIKLPEMAKKQFFQNDLNSYSTASMEC